MPEIIEAFGKSDSEFQAAYGFSKPEKTINNLVVGCLGGKRAAAAAEQLQQIGFSTIKYDHFDFHYESILTILYKGSVKVD